MIGFLRPKIAHHLPSFDDQSFDQILCLLEEVPKMSWISYKLKAEKLAKRLEKTYHMIGGAFLFFWVHDAPSFTLSFTATAHFAADLAGQASTPVSNFFCAANGNTGIISNGISLWSAIGRDNTKKFIVTGPEQMSQLTSKRKATERCRQPEYIIRDLNELKKEGFSFVFLYRPLKMSQVTICEVFPEAHAPILVNTDAWKQLLQATATLPPARKKYVVANRRPAAVQPSLGPAPRQTNSAVVDGSLESEKEDSEVREKRQRIHSNEMLH